MYRTNAAPAQGERAHGYDRVRKHIRHETALFAPGPTCADPVYVANVSTSIEQWTIFTRRLWVLDRLLPPLSVVARGELYPSGVQLAFEAGGDEAFAARFGTDIAAPQYFTRDTGDTRLELPAISAIASTLDIGVAESVPWLEATDTPAGAGHGEGSAPAGINFGLRYYPCYFGSFSVGHRPLLPKHHLKRTATTGGGSSNHSRRFSEQLWRSSFRRPHRPGTAANAFCGTGEPERKGWQPNMSGVDRLQVVMCRRQKVTR